MCFVNFLNIESLESLLLLIFDSFCENISIVFEVVLVL